MRHIRDYIDAIEDETRAATRYAEEYTRGASWARDFTRDALKHAHALEALGQDFIDALTWVDDSDARAWSDCRARFAGRRAIICATTGLE